MSYFVEEKIELEKLILDLFSRRNAKNHFSDEEKAELEKLILKLIKRSDTLNYFSREEKIELEKLKFDSKIEPSFDLMRSCLVWSDERPDRYSTESYDRLRDLWIARYFIYHSNIPEKEWWISEQARIYYKICWKTAFESGVKWPGFRKERLFLRGEDKEYLREELEKLRSSTEL